MTILLAGLLLCPGYLKLTREAKGLAIEFLPLWWVLLARLTSLEKKSPPMGG
jgi:hypothetical protein